MTTSEYNHYVEVCKMLHNLGVIDPKTKVQFFGDLYYHYYTTPVRPLTPTLHRKILFV